MVASSPAALMVVVIAGCGASASRPPAAPDSSHPVAEADVTITTKPPDRMVNVWRIDDNDREDHVLWCQSPCYAKIPAGKVRVEAVGVSRDITLRSGRQHLHVYRGSPTASAFGVGLTVTGACAFIAGLVWWGLSTCTYDANFAGRTASGETFDVYSSCDTRYKPLAIGGAAGIAFGTILLVGGSDGIDVSSPPQRTPPPAPRLQLRPGPVTSVVVQF